MYKVNKRNRIAEFTVDEVKQWVSNPVLFRRGKPYHVIDGIRISLRRTGPMIKVGPACKHCGVVGTKFCLEQFTDGSYHLDFYTEDDILLTIDHVYPKSKGGQDHVSNYQCLCYPCNQVKGDQHES